MTGLLTLVAASSAVALAPPASAVTETLYAVGYVGPVYDSGISVSNLYTVDASTGDATLVGPITVDDVAQRAITGIDVAPNGDLYAVDNDNDRLLTIDKATGAATVAGSFGESAQLPDITFDAYGYLFGWNEHSDDLVRLGLDGQLRRVGEFGYGTAGTGLAATATNVLWMKTYSELRQVDPTGGTAIGSAVVLTADTNNPADFDAAGTLYSVYRPQTFGASGTGSTLQTVDVATGAVTAIGNDPDVMLTGIAFHSGTWTPLSPSAEFTVTNTPSVATEVVNHSVSFTIAVTNDGPDSSYVSVTDVLPAGLTYASDDSGGTYDPVTGVWLVGTLAAGGSASLTITVTPTMLGTLTNVASVSSSVYVPGPLPWASGSVVVTVGAAPGAPAMGTATVGDGRARLTWAPPADEGDTPVTSYQVYTLGGTYVAATTGLSIVLSGLPTTSASTFVVKAVNLAGAGAASDPVTVTPHAPTVVLAGATVAKGRVTVSFFEPLVAPLEVEYGSPLSFQIAGDKGKWIDCGPITGSTWPKSCTVKIATKHVTMRVSDNGGVTWGPASAPVTVTR